MRSPVLVSMLAIGLLTGCAAAPQSPPPSPANTRPEPKPTWAGAPKPQPGEAARAVYQTTPAHTWTGFSGKTKPGVRYDVKAACLAPQPTAEATYRVLLDGGFVLGAAVYCDGTPQPVYTGIPAARKPRKVTLQLTPDKTVTGAYVIVTPATYR